MTEKHVTLSAHQLRRVELALAGFAQGVVTLTFPGLEAEDGETVVLHDEEGTDIVAIPQASVDIRASRTEILPQIGLGTAPQPPGQEKQPSLARSSSYVHSDIVTAQSYAQ